jgi:hypothetical protein
MQRLVAGRPASFKLIVGELLEGVEQCFALLNIRHGHLLVPVRELGGVIGTLLPSAL